MSAIQPQSNSPARWFSEPAVDGVRPDASLNRWLTGGGLLTARLRAVSEQGFRLQVLDSESTHNRVESNVRLRQIVIWCNGLACIYAETCIPAATADAHPWLEALGDEPLGETLQTRENVERSPFEYARLSLPELPEPLRVMAAEEVWARRSEFRIDELPLTVTEFFLPALNDFEPPARRPAGQP